MAFTALLVPRNRHDPEQPEDHSDFTLAVSILDLRETCYQDAPCFSFQIFSYRN